MDNTKTINVLSLCTGYGGFELALQQIWPDAHFRVVAVEIEAYAAANLVAKAEQNKLAIEAVYSNVKTFPADVFRDCFDIVVGGYPCQPFSNAGKRRGKADPRHLWPYIQAILREIRPVWCIFENVRGHAREGLFDVLRDLHRLGYDVECGIFSAAECGASHRRERLFILADAQSLRHGGGSCSSIDGQWPFCPDRQERDAIRGEAEGQRIVADTSIERLQAGRAEQPENQQSQNRRIGSKLLADAGKSGFQRLQFGSGFILEGSSAPGPVTEFRAVARPGQRQFDWEHPRTIESGLGRTVDGYNAWVDRIRLCGNGIVPQTAVKAIKYLHNKFKAGE